MQELNSPLASLLMIPNREKAVDCPEGQGALQRDLQMEHGEIINGTKFNKKKCQILHWGQSNAGHKCKLGEAGEQPCREGPGGAGWQQGPQESAMCPGSPEGKPWPGVHQAQHNRPVRRGDRPAAFSAGAASPAVLGAVLGPTV